MDIILSILAVLAGIWLTHLSLRKTYRPYRMLQGRIGIRRIHVRQILEKYFKYYNLLKPEDKHIFEQKIKKFISNKLFIPRQFEKVTDEMKVLIAAAAVQLTFGLPQVYLKHFSKIVIYRDTYYSQINKKYHRGEVNPAYGIIVISWKNFLEGFSNPSAALNLGIHEMAHALRLENIILNGEHSFLDPELLTLWEKLAGKELDHFRSSGSHFFRSYAFENEDEFFAVAVEVFFENPERFKDHLPDLYYTLAALLNQDPLDLYQRKV